METHADVVCPFCWQTFEMPCDPGVSRQTLVYDCEVCCNPINLRFRAEHGAVEIFDAQQLP